MVRVVADLTAGKVLEILRKDCGLGDDCVDKVFVEPVSRFFRERGKAVLDAIVIEKPSKTERIVLITLFDPEKSDVFNTASLVRIGKDTASFTVLDV